MQYLLKFWSQIMIFCWKCYMNFDWAWIKTKSLEYVHHLIQVRPHCALILSYRTIGLEIIVYPLCPPASTTRFLKMGKFWLWGRDGWSPLPWQPSTPYWEMLQFCIFLFKYLLLPIFSYITQIHILNRKK